MESWENKIIADKLNSLQDLPADYTPNIASKWEIIQSGLSAKRGNSSKKNWIIVVFLIAFAGMLVWKFYPSEQPKTISNLNAVPVKQPDWNKDFPPASTITVKEKPPKQQTNILPKKTVEKVFQEDTSMIIQPQIISVELPIDSTGHLHKDTINSIIPGVAVIQSKRPRKTYTRDFEGVVAATDTVQSKTAKSLSLKIKLYNNSSPSFSDQKPALQLTRNF